MVGEGTGALPLEEKTDPFVQEQFVGAQREHERMDRERKVMAAETRHSIAAMELALERMRGVLQQMESDDWMRSPAYMAWMRSRQPKEGVG